LPVAAGPFLIESQAPSSKATKAFKLTSTLSSIFIDTIRPKEISGRMKVARMPFKIKLKEIINLQFKELCHRIHSKTSF